MDNIIIALIVIAVNVILGVNYGLDWYTVAGVGAGAALLGYGLHQVLTPELSSKEKDNV